MKTVYILSCGYGTVIVHIDGVFSTLESAEKEKKKQERIAKKQMQTPPWYEISEHNVEGT